MASITKMFKAGFLSILLVVFLLGVLSMVIHQHEASMAMTKGTFAFYSWKALFTAIASCAMAAVYFLLRRDGLFTRFDRVVFVSLAPALVTLIQHAPLLLRSYR